MNDLNVTAHDIFVEGAPQVTSATSYASQEAIIKMVLKIMKKHDKRRRKEEFRERRMFFEALKKETTKTAKKKSKKSKKGKKSRSETSRLFSEAVPSLVWQPL
jgi:hypothetical protein